MRRLQYDRWHVRAIFFLAGSALSVITVSGQGLPAASISACIKSTTGAIRVVSPGELCKAGESAAQWNLGTAATAPGLRVVDSAGLDLGAFFAYQNGSLAMLSTEDESAGVQVTRAGVTATGFTYFYQSANCTGQRYVTPTYGDFAELITVAYVAGNTAVWPGQPRAILNMQSSEAIAPDADPRLPGICTTTPTPGYFMGLPVLKDLPPVIVPPLKVQ